MHASPSIDGPTVKLGEKTMLLRSPKGRAYGMLFQLTHREMDTVYKDPGDYRAQPFLAVSASGETVAAISMVHVNPPIDSHPVPEYSTRWNELILRLGLPSASPSTSQ